MASPPTRPPATSPRGSCEFILAVGGISIEYGKALGRDLRLSELAGTYDAVFLGIGLPGVNGLGLDGEDAEGCIDAVEYIAKLRQSDDLSKLPVGRRIVVIGGGMTAIDIAIQTKLLGAEEVTICYRRGKEAMNASAYEQELAQTHGVTIRHWLRPKALRRAGDGAIAGIDLEYTRQEAGRLEGTGETVTLAADQVFKAIGQTGDAGSLSEAGLEVERDRIKVDAERRTANPKIWAGGDCISGGDDLTVVAVEDGKIAAESIHAALAS